MSDIAIQVEGLGKRYRIGARQQSYPTLRDALASSFSRLGRGRAERDEENTIWALKDVSFEVKQGEVLGIIGRNGAGKSTLLKVLSHITEPTEGQVRLYGRVGSLLEVGTGFHPELTGRENIFLNGAILGMRKAEIQRKFDEIVAFSEIEKFLDTPVKRYSSGMYVRLAFAVAAHMEPEILLVDEVLAVGDAEFQKKCLGKMGDVSKEGRTVLFVSHNMPAVQSLCQRAIFLNNGNMALDGNSAYVIKTYLTEGLDKNNVIEWNDIDAAPGNELIRVHSIKILDKNNAVITKLSTRDEFDIEVTYWNLVEGTNLELVIHLYTQEGILVFISLDNEDNWQGKKHPKGLYLSRCTIPGDTLNDNNYVVTLHFQNGIRRNVFWAKDILNFEISDSPETRGSGDFKWPGIIRPMLLWKKKLISRI